MLVSAGGVAGFTVKLALDVALPSLAAMMTAVEAATANVLIANVALVCPAGTVTVVAGWAAAALLLDRLITRPPLGAAAFSETVPEAVAPPTTLLGLTLA